MSSLDQSLSLKAQLRDEVSPALEKINRSAKTTQGALEELGNDAKKAGEVLGAAGESMAGANKRAAEKVQEDLKKTGGVFKELGQEAQQSAKQVGEALDGAFRSSKQARSVDELDEELEGLNRTLKGMASTNRPMAGRARNVRAIGQDTINKKVIPAFQELHSTLEELPDTLTGVNAGVRSQISLSDKMSSALDGVNRRISGLGKVFDKLKATFIDVAGAVTSSWFAVQGAKVREAQVTAGRQRGRKSFAAMEKLTPDIQRAAMAPDDVWGPAYEKLLDTSSLALEEFPRMIDQMTQLSKATGLSTDAFAELFVQMTELSGLTGDEWLDVTEKINFFASSSRASITDLHGVISSATEEMIGFSREARKAYAESSMAAAAQTANAGLGAGAAQDYFTKALTDIEFRTRLQGLTSRYGTGQDLGELIAGGKIGDFNAEVATAMAKFTRQEYTDRGLNPMSDPERRGFSAVAAGLSPEEGLRYANRLTELEKQGRDYFAELARLVAESKETDIAGLTGDIRGTAAEKLQQLTAAANSAGMDIGVHTVKAIEQGMDPLIAATFNMSNKLDEMPEMAKKGIAFFSIGLNLMSALKNFIPGLAGALEGPLETLAGATIAGITAKNVLEGGDVKAQAAALAPGMPELQAEIEKQLYNKLQDYDAGNIVGDSRKHYEIPVVPTPRDLTPADYEPNKERFKREVVGAVSEGYQVLQNPEKSAVDRMETSVKLVQQAINTTQQQGSLGASETALKAAYFQDNRDKMLEYGSKAFKDVWIEDIKSIPTMIATGTRSAAAAEAHVRYDAIEKLLKASPEEMMTMGDQLSLIVSDAQAKLSPEVQKQYGEAIRNNLIALDEVTDQLQATLTKEDLNDPKVQELQRQYNDLMSRLITSVETVGKETLTKTDLINLVTELRKSPLPPPTSQRTNEGVDHTDPATERHTTRSHGR